MSTSPQTDKMEASAASHLLRLPVELILEIASSLPVDAFCSFRLTSRTIARAIFTQFRNRFFQTRRILLPGQQNLKKFADMCSDQDLARSFSIQNVILVADARAFSEAKQRPLPGEPSVYPRGIADLQSDAFREFGGRFGAPQEDRATLAKALANLPELKAVQFRNVRGEPYSLEWSRAWTVDGPSNADDSRFMPHLFALAVAALVDANARPESLEWRSYKLANVGFNVSLADFAFHLPQHMESGAKRMLSRLETLRVSLGDCELGSSYPACFLKFLSLATQLVTLVIKFDSPEADLISAQVLQWLGRQPDGKQAVGPIAHQTTVDPVSFLRLERLHIWHVTITPAAMLSVFENLHHTLRDVELIFLHLRDAEHTVNHRVNIWTPFLKSVAELSNLRKFSLCLPAIELDHGPRWRRRSDNKFNFPLVYFRNWQDRANGDKPRNLTRLIGPDVSADIEALADEIYIPWPEASDLLSEDEDNHGNVEGDTDNEDDDEDDSTDEDGEFAGEEDENDD